MDKTTFRLFAEVGGGYSYKLSALKITPGIHTRDGMTGTFRLKWGSSKQLGIGIETGWIPISSTTMNAMPTEFGSVDFTTSLSAVPVLAIFSMQRLGIQFHTGIGYYRVKATATVLGTTMESTEWNLGFLLSLGYAIPLTSNYRIGTELKWNNIVEQQISVVSMQVRVMYLLYGE